MEENMKTKSAEEEREAFLNSLPLPYNMKKSEMIKEKLFFDAYPEKTGISEISEEGNELVIDEDFLSEKA